MAERETMAFKCVRTHAGGVGFAPTPRFAERAAEKFAAGAVYWLTAEAERSEKTHRHEFSWLKEAWKNLPENIACNFPSSEHLRKRALIDAGFFDEEIIDAGSKAAALRVAAGIRRRPGEEFTLVFARDCFVIIRTAKSQGYRAMDAAEFQRSKQAIAEVVADMLGITADELQKVRKAA